MIELPDLFYAHNPARYLSYRTDCSCAYSNFHSFARHSLEKHWARGNVEREGITDENFLAARLNFVRSDMSLSQLDRYQYMWKAARHALFGTPLSVPIPGEL